MLTGTSSVMTGLVPVIHTLRRTLERHAVSRLAMTVLWSITKELS
jgi:hypothetical protein